MKKILTAILVLLLVVGCSKKTYTQIDYAKLMEKINNEESFVLFIGADTCTACQTLKPKLNKVIERYNIDDVYYVDIQQFKENESIDNIVRITGTPTIAFIENGKEKSAYNRIEDGNASSKEIISIFEKNNYIEGE